MSEQKVELDYKMKYEQFIQDEGLDITKFPVEIGKKVRTMKMLVGKYNSKPSDARKEHIIREDIATANLMANWQERNFPDEIIDANPTSEKFEDELVPVTEVVPVVETPSVVEVPPVVETPPIVADDTEKIAQQEKSVMESKSGNRIKQNILEGIIGYFPTEKFIKVGKITLKKVFLYDGYEII